MTADFVAAMEDVLDLYAQPYDPRHPKVNFDEMSKQLIEETTTSKTSGHQSWTGNRVWSEFRKVHERPQHNLRRAPTRGSTNTRLVFWTRAGATSINGYDAEQIAMRTWWSRRDLTLNGEPDVGHTGGWVLKSDRQIITAGHIG